MSRSPSAVIESFVLGPFATNCFIVRSADASGCFIVDVGFEPAPLIERVREAGLRPEAVILTHAHADHIAGLHEVRRAFAEAAILIHQAEAAWLNDPELNLSAGFGQPLTAPPADRLLEGGERLTLGASSWEVLHTPGHSPGGVTVWSEAEAAAIVGDTLFAGSIGRFDFPTSDQRTLFRSIRETLYGLPDDTTVYPGHGPETTIGHEKATNPFVQG